MQIRSIKGYLFHISKTLRIMEQEETFEKVLHKEHTKYSNLTTQ